MAPSQERFVSERRPSRYAKPPSIPALTRCTGRSMPRTRAVGFVMIADEVSGPDYIPHYLWKLLIDERHQRQGYGTATLDLIVEYFRDRPGVEALTTSAGQGEGSPLAFYERYGFERTRVKCSTARWCFGSSSGSSRTRRWRGPGRR